MTFKKGDILQGTDRNRSAAYHYIVYLGQSLDRSFVGVILTTSAKWPNNVPLPENFFHQRDDYGQDYKVRYNSSYFMRVKLDKPDEWGPYKKVGQLTVAGVEFIENHVLGMEPITYQMYDQTLRTT